MISTFVSNALVLFALGLPATRAANIDVSVGNGVLRFDPPSVSASVGDTINFVFHPKAHSVTQSSFAQPCTPLQGGFDSGLIPVTAGTTNLPNYQVVVNDTSAPIWIYCKQQGPPAHCGQGMVFAINAPADPNPHSFSAFQAAANATASNSTSTSASASGSSSASAYITPSALPPTTVTVTVTEGSSTWTTTYASYPGSPPPTPTANPIDHQITVGANGQLAFNPSNISASIGDTVTFFFNPKNHTVTRSSFASPCVPLGGVSGFNSGFMPIDASATANQTTFKITVNDTAPIWGFCAQTNPVDHCGSGMVFSINAIESGPNNFTAFQGLAKHINGSTSGSSTGSSTGSASSSTSTSGKKSGAANLAPAGFKAWSTVLAVTALAFGAML